MTLVRRLDSAYGQVVVAEIAMLDIGQAQGCSYFIDAMALDRAESGLVADDDGGLEAVDFIY
jgi:hypothetical protein